MLTMAAVPEAAQPCPGAAGACRLPCPAPRGEQHCGALGTASIPPQPCATLLSPALSSHQSPGLRADHLRKVQLLESSCQAKAACRRDSHWPCRPRYSVEALEEFKGRIHLPSGEETRRHTGQLGDTEPSERTAQRPPLTLHTKQLQEHRCSQCSELQQP